MFIATLEIPCQDQLECRHSNKARDFFQELNELS